MPMEKVKAMLNKFVDRKNITVERNKIEQASVGLHIYQNAN